MPWPRPTESRRNTLTLKCDRDQKKSSIRLSAAPDPSSDFWMLHAPLHQELVNQAFTDYPRNAPRLKREWGLVELLFQFGPSGIQLFDSLVGLFYPSASDLKPWGVAHNRGVLQRRP